jgi:hypothetical protein
MKNKHLVLFYFKNDYLYKMKIIQFTLKERWAACRATIFKNKKSTPEN